MRHKSFVTPSFAAPILAATLCLMSANHRAQAKPMAPSVRNQAATTALTIPDLPNARVQLELDATEKDLLGMVKSFVRGLEKANAQKGRSGSTSMLLQMVSDKQFSAVLKDIHHLHVVVYDMNDDNDSSATMSVPMNGGDMATGGMTMNGDMTTNGASTNGAATSVASARVVPDALAFYDKPFRAEGGRRVLKADFKSTRVVMFGFQKAPGFALVVTSPSRIVVARADAYPDMEALGRMIEFATPEAPQKNAALPKSLKAPAAKAPAAKAPAAKAPAAKAKAAATKK